MFATTKKTSKSARNKTRLGLETLEHRRVMAVASLGVPIARLPVDHAGGTPATAQVVNLELMEQVSLSDHLPSLSDVDVYRVALNKGDYLVADADATGTTPLNGTLAILNSQAQQLAFSQYATEPENGASNDEPAIGFHAPADGNYFVQVKTTASTFHNHRGYQLNLHRIGLDDVGHSVSDLAEDGKFRAWLNASGTSLQIAGPTGYGFSLEGDWKTSLDKQTVTYKVDGPVTLRTSYLDGSVGGLPMAAGSDGFSVTVQTPGWNQLGELKSTGGGLGFPLGLLTEDIDRELGTNLSEITVAAKWTIMTGEQVRANFPQHEIAQVLDGVPYLAYGKTGKLVAEVGQVTVTSGSADGVILIADPADPFLYAGYDDYAVAGSLEGRIPFNSSVGPGKSTQVGGMLPQKQAVDAYFGHLYLAGEMPLAGFKAPVIGDLAFTGEAGVTINLDANGDGAFLSGAGTAQELLSGNLSAFETAMRDIRFAANGEANVGFDVAGRAVKIPLGSGSIYYSGPQQGLFFDGIQGMGANAWKGTALEDFRSDSEIRVNGYAYRDGNFSVTQRGRYYLLGNYAELGITVRSEGTVASTEIIAAGTLHTGIGDAYVSGTIGLNGNFVFTGNAAFNIGNNSNYIRGQGTCTLRKTGSSVSLTVEGKFSAQVKIDNFAKASGAVEGKLTMGVDAGGNLSYSTNLSFSGDLYVWNPAKNNLDGGWSKVGSTSGKFGIGGNKLRVSLGGHHFAVALP